MVLKRIESDLLRMWPDYSDACVLLSHRELQMWEVVSKRYFCDGKCFCLTASRRAVSQISLQFRFICSRKRRVIKRETKGIRTTSERWWWLASATASDVFYGLLWNMEDVTVTTDACLVLLLGNRAVFLPVSWEEQNDCKKIRGRKG